MTTFAEARLDLVRRPGLDGPGRRAALTQSADVWLADLFAQAKALTSYSSSHLEDKANNEKVIALLEDAVKIDPQFAEAHAKLGLAYVIRLFLFAPQETDLQQKAYLAIEHAFRLNPNLAEAYEARGRLRWTAFNHFPHQDAIRDFRQALKINPDLRSANFQISKIYLGRGDTVLAEKYFKQGMVGGNPTAEMLLVGIRIARAQGDKNNESSYALLLRNKYPNSEEAKKLREEAGQ